MTRKTKVSQDHRILEIQKQIEVAELENIRLSKELDMANNRIAELEAQLKFLTPELRKVIPELMIMTPEYRTKQIKDYRKTSVLGWTVNSLNGYFRAFKRINGTLHSVYIGKDITKAELVIAKKEMSITGKTPEGFKETDVVITNYIKEQLKTLTEDERMYFDHEFVSRIQRQLNLAGLYGKDGRSSENSLKLQIIENIYSKRRENVTKKADKIKNAITAITCENSKPGASIGVSGSLAGYDQSC